MEITREKHCPRCGSLNITFLGHWETVRREHDVHDVPGNEFLDTDRAYRCNGSECDTVFIIRD